MTKRETASKLITRGNWPSMRYSIQSALLTRSTTSQKELNLCMLLGLVPSQLQRFVAKMSATFFYSINSKKIPRTQHILGIFYIYRFYLISRYWNNFNPTKPNTKAQNIGTKIPAKIISVAFSVVVINKPIMLLVYTPNINNGSTHIAI